MLTPQRQTEKMVSSGGNLLDLQLSAICCGYFPCLQIAAKRTAGGRISRPKAGKGLSFSLTQEMCQLSPLNTSQNHCQRNSIMYLIQPMYINNNLNLQNHQ